MEFLPQSLDALRSFPQFITYKLVPNGEKTDKIPVDPRTGWAVNPLDPKNWMDADTAIKLAKENGLGVGYVFTEVDPFWFLDIDKCAINGQWSELATSLLQAFPGAAVEISQSGQGLHIFGCGTAPAHGCRNQALGLEFYNAKRFVALTGYSASGNIYQDFTPQLDWLVNTYFAGNIGTSPANSDFWNNWRNEPAAGFGIPDDDELIDTAHRSKRDRGVFSGEVKPTFTDLFERNESVLAQAYPSSTGDVYDGSSADIALAGYIGFYAGGNYDQIQRVMRRSALSRDKWDSRPDYLPRTIVAACGKQTTYYSRKVQVSPHSSESQVSGLSEYDYPELTWKGKPLNTEGNLIHLLNRYNITVRWNKMSRTRQIIIPHRKIAQEDIDNSALTILTDIALQNYLPVTRIDELLGEIAYQNAFHPIVDAMRDNIWDGEPRVKRFIATLKTTNDGLAEQLIWRWMICAMAAAHSDAGFSNQGVLTLAGEQGIGKTYWVKSLDPLNCGAVREGVILDPANKDSVAIITSCWIAELGEVDGTFRKADIARLKSFTTADKDIYRMPYARKTSSFPRRTVFAATVNETEFLIDSTGNRRWWTVEVEGIEHHNLDMMQIWAEIYHFWSGGETTVLDTNVSKALNQSNIQHQQIDPLQERVLKYFDWEQPPALRMSTTMVLMALGYGKPTGWEAQRMSAIIRKLTQRKPIRNEHLMPPIRLG